MTILGNHTVAEVRDFIKRHQFRVNRNAEQLLKIQSFRIRPPTEADLFDQRITDKLFSEHVDKWGTIRDRETVLMTASVVSNPVVPADALPAEPSWKAVTKLTQEDTPNFAEIEGRISAETRKLGLPALDLASQPAGVAVDVDFAALRKLDKEIKAGEDAAKGAAKSNTGLLIGLGVAGVVGVVVATKVYL